MKDNKAVIAKNPLSQNIANILKYKKGMLESELRREAKIISDKIKDKFGKSLNFETIVSWTLAEEEDPAKARAFIGLDRISMFAEVVGVNYWELFIPEDYTNLNSLSPKKRDTIKMVMQLDEKFLDDVQSVIIVHVREEAERMANLYENFSDIMRKPEKKDGTQ